MQDFHKDPSAQQKKELQSAPVVLHPDFTLDQNSKILTLNQGQATIFGQKYTLPALPFKLPATPALNSLQSLYPSKSCLKAMVAYGKDLIDRYPKHLESHFKAEKSVPWLPTQLQGGYSVTFPFTQHGMRHLAGCRDRPLPS